MKAQWIAWAACLGLFLAFPAGSAAEERWPAGSVVDGDVVNEHGEKIGEVDDLVLRRSGRVKKAALEVGGFLDVFDKIVAVSFAHVSRLETGNLLVKATKEQLDQKPAFRYLEEGLQPEYYYRSRPYAGPPHFTPRGYYYRPEPAYPPAEQWAFSPARFLATAVMDRNVMNRQGRSVGMIEDLLIQDGEVKAFVLSSHRVLGEGVHVTVPYRPLGFTAFGLVYDITRQELKERPRFTYDKGEGT
jgi:sporulation protein YlmC with PRC-barrel domain